MDDILCTLSVISFSSARLDRISPLSLGWLLHWSPQRHLFPLSLSLLFSLFLSVTAVFLKLYELVTTPFFPPHLLSYFLISAMDADSTPASRQTVHLSVHLSDCHPRPPFCNACLAQNLPGKKYKMKLRKKKIYRDIFFKKKSWCSRIRKWKAAVDRMASQLPAIRTPFLLLPLRLGRHRGWCVCVCVRPCLCVYLCVQLLCGRFPELEPSLQRGKWRTVATTGQFYSAPGWMLNLYLMYDISHKSSGHRHDPGVFGRLLFQCLSNCGIIRLRERERGEKKPLSLAKWSPSRCSGHPRLEALSLFFFLCDIMIAGPCQIENILAVWRLYEITIYYV